MKKFTKKSNLLAVILNWNGAADTIACLKSLRQSEEPVDYYILDNNSRAADYQLLANQVKEWPNLFLQRSSTNLGFTGGNNLGIRFALANNYDYILLLNNDTVIKADSLKIMLAELKKNTAAALIAPKIYYFGSEKIWHGAGRINFWTAKADGLALAEAQTLLTNNFDFLSGCCWLMKTEITRQIGLLDENFFAYCEDLDYCQRVKKAGWQLLYEPRAILWHKVSQSTGGDPFKPRPLYLRTRNRILFIKKWGTGPQKIFFFGYHSLYALYFIGRGLLTGNWAMAKAAALGYCSGWTKELSQ